jgi:DNA-binding NtrC family response regulator
VVLFRDVTSSTDDQQLMVTVNVTSDDGGHTLVHRTAALRVVEGADVGLEVELGHRPTTIGTAPACDLVLTDRRVSSRHAEVVLRPAGYLLRDLGSRNGTQVAGGRVEGIYLVPGMRIGVGRSALEVIDRQQLEETPLSQADRFGDVLGRSLPMRVLFAQLERLVESDCAILLEGETGTGKTFIAEQIHRRGPCAARPFEVFDCGAVAPNLLESELFGHVKGAFTGAVSSRAGVLERADGGTLFLDEVNTLPQSLQPKLLRAFETQRFAPVGSSGQRSVKVRIITASNVNLEREVAQGRFRSDLYYRLAVVSLLVPPLRDRIDDLPLLVEQMARPLLPDGVSLTDRLPGLLPLLGSYSWPGNVRELRNVVERLCLLPPEQALPSALRPPDRDADAMLSYHDARGRAVDQFERLYVTDLVRSTGGNVSEAARVAGVSRRLITALMGKHQIRREDL